MKTLLTTGFLAWIIISFAAFSFRIDPVERDLKQRSEEVLSRAGFDSLAIENAGRDFTLSGNLPSSEEKASAVSTVEKVYGVRTVVDAIKVVAVESDSKEVVVAAVENNDIDGDGVNNELDAFPSDASEQIDSDADGIGDNADTDDDNDGVKDLVDAFPLDSSEQLDTDGDGIGNPRRH